MALPEAPKLVELIKQNQFAKRILEVLEAIPQDHRDHVTELLITSVRTQIELLDQKPKQPKKVQAAAPISKSTRSTRRAKPEIPISPANAAILNRMYNDTMYGKCALEKAVFGYLLEQQKPVSLAELSEKTGYKQGHISSIKGFPRTREALQRANLNLQIKGKGENISWELKKRYPEF